MTHITNPHVFCFITEKPTAIGIFKLRDSKMAAVMCTCSSSITNDIFKSTNANDESGV